MNTIPKVVTHNYDPEGAFLANLCDLPLADAEKVLQRIRDSGKRTVKANYLQRRFDTEAWLICERQRRLGRTRRERPIYFFLGNFADGKDPSRPCSLVMPLRSLPADVITFTIRTVWPAFQSQPTTSIAFTASNITERYSLSTKSRRSLPSSVCPAIAGRRTLP